MFRKWLFLILATILLTGCGNSREIEEDKVEKKQYQASFLNLFDTVTTILGYAETEEEFEKHIFSSYYTLTFIQIIYLLI